MQAVKAVKQNYTPSPELLALLEAFRKMVNTCIRIGLAENITSMKSLSKKAYHELAVYNVPTQYRLTAVSKATGILSNYRRTLRKQAKVKKPYASKLMLVDCYNFRIINNQLRLPIKPREYIYIALNAYTLRSIQGYTVRSVCLTACTISMAFSKETAQIEPIGLIGIDSNLDNVTTVSSPDNVKRYDLSHATEVKENCRQSRRGFTRNDYRVRQEIYSKYGRIEKNKVNWLLHNTSANIVREAREKQYGIIMENLRGIRKLYRKGNGQGRNYRARMNGWSFAELQRQIEYKAKWGGIPVYYVNPLRTSSTCAVCGFRIVECAGRMVYCPHCKNVADRDLNAALNIRNAGLRFSLKGMANETMKGNPRNGGKVILRADTAQLPNDRRHTA